MYIKNFELSLPWLTVLKGNQIAICALSVLLLAHLARFR